MSTFTLLLSLWIQLVHVYSQNEYNYTNFKQFGIKLPRQMQQHITAIYNDKLYVFGGMNSSTFIDITFITEFWFLDLSQVNLVLSSEKNDIDTSVLDTAVQWQSLTVNPPSYGPASSGVIRCIHQCSTLVDKYLYIASAYGESSSGYSSYMYRLDLSLDPPVYSDSSAFTSTALYSVAEPCITSTNDGEYIYMVGGNKASGGVAADKDLSRYSISTNEWSTLQSMNEPRQSAGCATSYNDDEVYIFGGRSDCDDVGTCSTLTGSKTIDTYTVDTDTWTDNMYLVSAQLWQTTFDIKCMSNVYDETIICAGGMAQRAWDEAIIYNTPEKDIIDTVYLWKSVTSYGMAMYELVNDGNDEAQILFVVGGSNGDLEVYDSIQYMVIYNVPTDSPTSAPSMLPTLTPTMAPTVTPTMAPSQAPTQPPSIAPTFSPTDPKTTAYVTLQGTAAEKQTEVYGEDPASSTTSKSMTVVIVICLFVFILY